MAALNVMKIPRKAALACVHELEKGDRGKWFWYSRDCIDALHAISYAGEWMENEDHALLTFALAASIAGVVDKRGLPV